MSNKRSDCTLAARPDQNFLYLETVVEVFSFSIYEDIGCFPVILDSWMSIGLISIWPIVIGLVSAVYSGKFTELDDFFDN